jgi:ectoine hydroxylase-related dioxygenase (phytanoyl-CoA dioxygenase family)
MLHASSPSPAEGLLLHPWNRGFAWRDHDGPFTSISVAQAEAFDRDGFFVVDGAVTGAALARTVAEIDRFEARVTAELASREGGRDDISQLGSVTFTGSLVLRSHWLASLATGQPFAGVARDLLGSDVVLYWDQAAYKKPEQPRRFPWHQDTGFVFVEPQAYVTCWLALTDTTAENGCVHVVPGLHRLGTIRHRYVDPLGFECFEDHPGAVCVELSAGSMVVFSSLTPHMTPPNVTGAVRKSYILQYAIRGSKMLKGDPDGPDGPNVEPCELARMLPVAAP